MLRLDSFGLPQLRVQPGSISSSAAAAAASAGATGGAVSNDVYWSEVVKTEQMVSSLLQYIEVLEASL